jgi:hypothetical protein
MKKVGDSFDLSATDLVGYLNCHHLAALDRAVAASLTSHQAKRGAIQQLKRDLVAHLFARADLFDSEELADSFSNVAQAAVVYNSADWSYDQSPIAVAGIGSHWLGGPSEQALSAAT